MNDLILCIKGLIDFRSEIEQPIEQHFLPGLSRELIQEKVSQYPFHFPEEFIELYSWRNGMQGEDFLIFRDKAWLSLEAALSEYEFMMENFWEGGDNEELGLEPEKMFPFAALGGKYLFLSYPGQRMCPSLEIPVICTAPGYIEPYYNSFISMLETVHEWFSVGEHNESYCSVEEILELDVWRKHNPQAFEARTR
jgi:hypothetical protein